MIWILSRIIRIWLAVIVAAVLVTDWDADEEEPQSSQATSFITSQTRFALKCCSGVV